MLVASCWTAASDPLALPASLPATSPMVMSTRLPKQVPRPRPRTKIGATSAHTVTWVPDMARTVARLATPARVMSRPARIRIRPRFWMRPAAAMEATTIPRAIGTRPRDAPAGLAWRPCWKNRDRMRAMPPTAAKNTRPRTRPGGEAAVGGERGLDERVRCGALAPAEQAEEHDARGEEGSRHCGPAVLAAGDQPVDQGKHCRGEQAGADAVERDATVTGHVRKDFPGRDERDAPDDEIDSEHWPPAQPGNVEGDD